MLALSLFPPSFHMENKHEVGAWASVSATKTEVFH